MTAKNDVTGDVIRSKINNKTGYDAYREGWERIFGSKNVGSDKTGNQDRKSRTPRSK